MTRIQTPSHAEALRVEFKTREPVSPILSNVISPVVVLSDLSGANPAGTGYPRGGLGFTSVAAGGVGTNAQNVVRGVEGRGFVWVVDAVLINKGAIGAAQIRLANGAAIAGLTQGFGFGFTDQRVGDRAPDLFLGVSTPLTAAIDGTQVGNVEFAVVNDSLLIPLGIILGSESDWVSIVNGTTNESMTSTWYWTTYELEDR